MNNRKKESENKKIVRVTVLFTEKEGENLIWLAWKLKTDKSNLLRDLFISRWYKLPKGQKTIESYEEQQEEKE